MKRKIIGATLIAMLLLLGGHMIAENGNVEQVNIECDLTSVFDLRDTGQR